MQSWDSPASSRRDRKKDCCSCSPGIAQLAPGGDRQTGLLQLQSRVGQARFSREGESHNCCSCSPGLAQAASSAWYGDHGCRCCSCSFNRPCLLCQIRRVGLLGQRENSRVGSDPAPLAFTVSDLRRGVGNNGQTIQVQQALPGMEGRVVAVPVAVAIAASSKSSVRYGGHGCCRSSCSCSQL